MQQPNPISPWQAWSVEVQHKLKEQQEQLEALEVQVAALCNQVKQLEARPTYNIESIEYHFDQLKVEKLDGTLNIGMTTPGAGDSSFPGSIEQLSVSKPQTFPSAGPSIPSPSPIYQNVFDEMNCYLDTKAPDQLLKYENELSIPLDPYHRKIIIEDIRKQVPSRIQYYMQQTAAERGNLSASNDSLLVSNILAKTTRDSDAALLAYMQRLQNGTPSS